jgi:hypothetical protein
MVGEKMMEFLFHLTVLYILVIWFKKNFNPRPTQKPYQKLSLKRILYTIPIYYIFKRS